MADSQSHENDNGNAARRWERYALSLLYALVTVLSMLFWEMRRDVMDLRRTSDQRTAAVIKLGEHETWMKEHNTLMGQWSIRLVIMEQKLMTLDERATTQSRMIQTLYRQEHPTMPNHIAIGDEDQRR